MTQKNYRAYAQTPQGRAARSRAHAKYVERRRAMNQADRPLKINPRPLAQALKEWRPQ